MYPVVETVEFSAQAARLWTDAERNDFVCWIAANAEAGDVIPGAEGARKLRWAACGRGKRGGAREIYFNQPADGPVILIEVYATPEQTNLPAKKIRGVKREAEKH